MPGKKPKYAPKGLYYRKERECFVYRWRDHSSGKYRRFSLDREIQSWPEACKIIKTHKERIRTEKLARLDPSLITLGAFKEAYTQHRARLPLANDTKRRDAQALDSLISILGDGCLLRTINQTKIDRWAGALLENGTKTTTINSYLRHLKAALRWATKTPIDDTLPQSPALLAVMPDLQRYKEPQRLPRALSRKEAVRILWREKDLVKRGLWRFFLATGLRRGEVMGLDWRHMHLDVPEPFCLVIGKGNKQRAVPLLPEAVKALARLPRYDMGPVWRFELRLKPGLHTVCGDTLSHWFKDAARRADIQDAHLHDLRHTCATWLAARAVPERAIQEVLGHSSITVTQIYTKGYARAANLYRAMLDGKK